MAEKIRAARAARGLSQLAGWGILDRRAVVAALPLAELLDRFKETLSARGNTALHARSTFALVRRVFDATGAKYWSDIDPAGGTGAGPC